ncbi:MAG: nuclear transport factor 2 family protein [Proteobacteria bacterium]|nr:nuclear transport factor 2 family protein [Pseudomonadota bacterium]
MHTLRLSLASVCGAALMTAMALSLMSMPALAAGSDTAAVVAANAQFYIALNKMFTGDAVPMNTVWSHGDDVTYMGPTGDVDVGWNAVLKNWQAQAKLKLGGEVNPIEMHLIVGQDVAIVSDYEQGANTNAKGKTVHVKLRATNMFRKEGGQWKMVGHHTDLLPYLAK